MSGSLPGTWTGTDTPGEMSPAEIELGGGGRTAVKRDVFSYLLFFKNANKRQRATKDKQMQHARLA